MRIIANILPALLLAGLSSAAPTRKRDSSSGEEVAVSAPFGIPLSDTDELSSQLSTETSFGDEPTPLPGYSTDTLSAVSVDTTTTTDLPAETDTFSAADSVASVETVASSSSDYIAPPAETAPPYVSSGSSYVPPVAVGSGSGYSMPSYGSGSVSWESTYNSCVQTCMASYPPPPTVISLPPSSSYSAPPSVEEGSSSPSSDSEVSSTGATTWKIVVAPKKGVLRFVPFSVNAKPGDILQFTWGAGPHTVTQSSGEAPCNATLSGFKSGSQNATFVFEQTVNSTDPIWFYCGIPTHCQKGMFGVVNPPTLPGAPSSVEAMMPQWAASNPDIATTLAYTQNLTAGTSAAKWGSNIDVSGIDPMYHAGVANSVLLTRATIAANPDMVDENGVFRPTGNVKIPEDLSSFLDTTDAYGSSADPPASSSSASAAASPTATPNSASSVASSSFSVVAAFILVAAML